MCLYFISSSPNNTLSIIIIQNSSFGKLKIGDIYDKMELILNGGVSGERKDIGAVKTIE